MPAAFISYSHKDRDFAERLTQRPVRFMKT
jgi:hypothetical protein